MDEPILWVLVGITGTLVTVWLITVTWRGYHRWRYGLPIAHEELLVQYGRRMAALRDREALARLLAQDVSRSLDASQATVLLAEGHDLVALDESCLRVPVLHAAVRRVASGGEAVRVEGRLRELLAQGRTELDWTAVWVPLMRSTDLYGIWLLGQRAGGRAYAPEDQRWLTTLARQAAIVLETILYAEQEQQLAQEMQALYRQAVSARESERERLSRELHDGVLQDLCAVARDLKAMEAAAQGAAASGDAAHAPLAGLVNRSNESVQTLRAICHDLRPPLLSNNPTLALKSLVERLDAHSSAPIHIEVSTEDLCLSEETALAMYRIAQESLHNAIQHADASEIAVRLTQYPDFLRMTVTDDGQGIPNSEDLGRFVAQGHFGLAGMRERATMIGGTLDIQSAVDYGTAVILKVPR